MVSRVVMEATSDYWRPPFWLLEAAGFEVWLVNARDVKHLPGRPKTDRLDAVWLCQVAERQMIRPSFVPPAPIRRLRDLTRYRVTLVTAVIAEKNRVEKLLEDAQIKVSVVAADIFGVSGRLMMAALIDGERDPPVLAQLARARLRAKLPALEEAFVGHFTDHHGFLLAKMLTRIDMLGADIAEVGVDMTRFPTPAHLASWARFAPRSQGVRRAQEGRRGHRPRQPLPGPRPRRSRRRGRPHRHLPRRTPPAHLAAAARRKLPSRSGAPSSRSSGNCSPIPTRSSTTSAPPSTTPARAPNAPSPTTSVNSRPLATRSPSNPPA